MFLGCKSLQEPNRREKTDYSTKQLHKARNKKPTKQQAQETKRVADKESNSRNQKNSRQGNKLEKPKIVTKGQ